MKTPITRILTSVAVILAVAGCWPLLAASSQEEEEREETFTMVAIPTKGSARITIDITLRIKKFTTDEKVLELIEVLKEGGTDQLRRTMEKMQNGKVTPRGRIGADVAVARVHKTEEGERFIVVTARTIPGFELYVSGRSRDYPFGWFEFEVDEEGKGIGMGALIVAAKLQFNKEGQFEIVSYGIQPYQLVNIKRW
jgi:hypothetical protein